MIISWIPDELLRGPGRLGLTCSPGSEERTRDADLDSLAEAGVELLVCLQEVHELRWMAPPETLEERRSAVEARGMRFEHAPIEDYTAPDMESARRLVAKMCAALDEGRAVVVHCWAGLGRAGTAAACVLIARGSTARDALSLVRRVRPGAVQSRVQEDLIALFGADAP